MLREIVLGLILLCFGLAATADPSFAAGEPLKLKIIYSSFTGAYTPLWLAVDDRLGKKYGLDFEAVYAGRARPHQLLLSGDAQYVVSTGTGVVSSYAAGAKDLVIIASFMSTTGSSIFSRQQIKTVKELQGKNIASGRRDEMLEETYGYFSKRMPKYPYPSVEAIKTALEMMADQFPQASSVDAQEVVDLTCVKQVEAGR